MSKAKVFLVSIKNPDLRYEVLRFDKESNTATLQGQFAEFEVTPFTKEKVLKDGYTLVTEEAQHA